MYVHTHIGAQIQAGTTHTDLYILYTYYVHTMYILCTYYVHTMYILCTYYVHTCTEDVQCAILQQPTN